MTVSEGRMEACIAEVSTASVDDGEKFDYFCETACKVFTGIRPEQSEDRVFHADFRAFAIGDSILATISAPGHCANRQQAEIRRQPDEHLFLNVCEYSSYRADCMGSDWQLPPGMPFLIDNARPFRLDFDRRSPMTLWSLRFDKNALPLDGSVSRLQRMNNAMVRSHSGRQLAQQMRLMCEATRAGKFVLAQQMSVPVLGLLSALCDENSDSPVQSGRPDLDCIKNVARNHLTDPDFDIHKLARIFHCTARTIQARFAESDESFSRWMLAERLDLARSRLNAPNFGPRSIETIAFSCGFRDASHFHRAFKARFSVPPGDIRH